MIDLTLSLGIPAPTVWAVLADDRRDPMRRTGVLSMEPDTEGPARAGTEVQEVLRLAGRTNRTGRVIDAVDPGRRVDGHPATGSDVNGHRRAEPTGADRCRVTLGTTVRAHGAERLLVPVLRRVLARTLQRDLQRLRDEVQVDRSAVAA